MSHFAKSKAEFRHLKGRLQAADGRDFERLTLPLLRLLGPALVPSPALGSFDRIGADHIAFADHGGISLIVQCKGFKATERELGRSQTAQCLKSIHSFATSGRRAKKYLLLHNRPGKNKSFRGKVTGVLKSLEDTGTVESAVLWDTDALAAAVARSLRGRLLASIRDVNRDAHARATPENEVLAAVPVRKCRMIVDRYRFKEVRDQHVGVADPAIDVLSAVSAARARVVLIGEAGFGKTTAAMRAAVSCRRSVFVVRAATLVEDPTGRNVLRQQFTFVDTLLGDVPPEDLPAIAPLARAVGETLFGSPNTPAILIIDGLDESITITRRGGLQWLFNSLVNFHVPVILVARTEFWIDRLTDFATSFGQIAQNQAIALHEASVCVVELVAWTSTEILALSERFADTLHDPEQRKNVEAFLTLVRDGRYDQVYGDIPQRPLFLRMILDTVARLGVHAVDRAQLVEEWARNKILRDYIEPLTAGGRGRVSILPAAEPVEATIKLAYRAMMRAAGLMTQRQGARLELLPSCRVQDILDAEPQLRNLIDPLGLFLNTLLVPVEGTGSELTRFGHLTYHEYYLAKLVQQRPWEFSGLELPAEVARWLRDLPRVGAAAKM